MDWWTGLWLNEGFAVYMENTAVDALFPEWNVWEMFTQGRQASGFSNDAMVSSHPVEVEVHHESEIDEVFDAIAYSKGACVVRMLGEFLGHDVFFKGVHEYLVEHSYGSTSTKDLWIALERVSGLQIAPMANSWTKQTGFPVVTISEKQDGSLTLTQQRFFSNPHEIETGDPTLWDIPLTLVTSANPTELTRIGVWNAKTRDGDDSTTPLLANNEITQRLNAAIPAGLTWVKLNPSQANFYLVNYPPAMWKQLQIPVKDKTLKGTDRLGLLTSAFMLTTAGLLSLPDAFDFLAAYREESEYWCWNGIAAIIARYSSLFCPEDSTDHDQHISNAGSWRSATITSLGTANDVAIIVEARKRVEAYLKGDESALSGDVRRAALVIYTTNASIDESCSVIERLRFHYDGCAIANEQLDCLFALGRVPDVNAKRELLEWAFSSGDLKPLQLSTFLKGIIASPGGLQVVWDYIKTHYDAIQRKFPASSVGTVVVSVIDNCRLGTQADEIEQFLSTKDVSAFKRRLKTALETARTRVAELSRDRKAMATWLRHSQFTSQSILQ